MAGFRFHHLLLAVAFLFSAYRASGAEPGPGPIRVGIVISNSAYTDLPEIASAHSDVDLIENSLRALQFDVVVRGRDLPSGRIEQLLRDIEARIAGRRVGTVFFYYEGHGGALQARGDNYLFPTDFSAQPGMPLEGRAVSLSKIVDAAVRWRPEALVFAIDSCRVVADFGTIAGAFEKPAASAAPLFVAFSTRVNAFASAGSPFAAEVAAAMRTRGADVAAIFDTVQKRIAVDRRQAPALENQLRGRAWLQPQWPNRLVIGTPRMARAPSGIQKPRMTVGIGGRQLWFQSGYWGEEAPAEWWMLDSSGRERWRGALGTPAERYVIDQVEPMPSGGWMLGGHREAELRWKPFLIELGADGGIRRRSELEHPAFGDRMRVRRMTIDSTGVVWAALSDEAGAADLIGKLPTLGSLFEVAGGYRHTRGPRILIDQLLVFDAEEVARRDCMLRPREDCGTLVFAAATELRVQDPRGLLLTLDKAGSLQASEISRSGASVELTWVGGRDCCRLVGTIQSPAGNELLIASANAHGLIDTANYVTFNPNERARCNAETAMALDDGAVLVLADCIENQLQKAILVHVSPSLRITSFESLCVGLSSCRAHSLYRERQGAIVAVWETDSGVAIGRVGIKRNAGTDVLLTRLPDPYSEAN